MNQSKKIKIILTSIVCSASVLFGGGCGGEEKAPSKVVQERPKAPPRPQARTVEKLVESLSIDPRIQLDELEAPKPEVQRIAILTFFDAMLRADA